MSIRIKAAAKSGIAVKVIGSLAVVGTAAGVAGMGTFGSFTDSTTAVDAVTDTGVLSIDLDEAANYATVPALTGGLLPGDYSATPFDLHNDGTVDWSAVNFKAWATRSSALNTDTVNGLQLTVESCSVSWTVAGPGTYSCPGEVTDFYAGPVVMDEPLQNAASLTAGGVDHLLATIALPADAANSLQGQRSDLSFSFTAMQRDGAAR